jgi:hypothetical protein
MLFVDYPWEQQIRVRLIKLAELKWYHGTYTLVFKEI